MTVTDLTRHVSEQKRETPTRSQRLLPEGRPVRRPRAPHTPDTSQERHPTRPPRSLPPDWWDRGDPAQSGRSGGVHHRFPALRATAGPGVSWGLGTRWAAADERAEGSGREDGGRGRGGRRAAPNNNTPTGAARPAPAHGPDRARAPAARPSRGARPRPRPAPAPSRKSRGGGPERLGLTERCGPRALPRRKPRPAPRARRGRRRCLLAPLPLPSSSAGGPRDVSPE